MTTATEPEPITARQREIYDAIVAYVEERGYAPTVRELQSQFEFASPNGVVCHLRVLEQRGWIARSAKRARTIRPTGGVR